MIINLIDFTVATRRTVNITFINDLSIWIFVQVVIHHILHIIVDNRSSSKIDHWFTNSAPILFCFVRIPDSLPLVIIVWVELNVATVATFNTQNVATLRNFNPPPGLRFAC